MSPCDFVTSLSQIHQTYLQIFLCNNFVCVCLHVQESTFIGTDVYSAVRAHAARISQPRLHDATSMYVVTDSAHIIYCLTQHVSTYVLRNEYTCEIQHLLTNYQMN